MKHLTAYKLFESTFVSKEEVDSLLDKISQSGITSLSDIEKNRLALFSEQDREIIETIEKMGDLTRKFKELNTEMRRCQDSGESDGFHLMDDWLKLNSQLRPLEASFRKWGIELGDERLTNLMRKQRPDVYNPNIFESKLFESKSGTSVIEIKDLLVDLVQNYFYIEVNRLSKNRKGHETTLEDDDILQPSDNFNIVIMTEKLLMSFSDDVSEFTNDPSELFSWNDVKDSVEQLISSLSEKYTLDECLCNVDETNRRGRNKHYYIMVGCSRKDSVVSCLTVSENGVAVDLDANSKIFCNVCITFNPKT